MRTLVRLLIVSLAIALTPSIAAADGEGGAYVNPDGTPVVVVEETGGSGGGGGGGGGDNCIYRVAVADDFDFGIFDENGNRMYSSTGRWLEKVCDGNVVAIGGQGIVPEGGAVDPRALADQAREQLPIPDPPIATSPDADEQTYAQVVTWLWIDNGWWTTYSKTATVSSGRVSATVTATPENAHWTTGDGGSLDCAGPGVEWRRGLADDDTYCSHVYRRSSAGQSSGTFPLTVEVAFTVSWSSNVGQSGTLAGVQRQSSRQIEVGEIQAIETE